MKYLLIMITLIGCGAEADEFSSTSDTTSSTSITSCSEQSIFAHKTMKSRWNPIVLSQIVSAVFADASSDIITAPNAHLVFLSISCAFSRLAQEISVEEASTAYGQSLFKQYLTECNKKIGL